MEWKLLNRITLILFLTLSFSANAAVYNLSTLRKKKVQYLIETSSIDKLQSFIEEGIKTPNIPTRIVDKYRTERNSVIMYKKIISGGALEIRSKLKNKFTEYYKKSLTITEGEAFSDKYNEALYLHYLSRQLNDKSRDDEIDSFSYLLLFISNRLSFDYDKAMQVHEALKDSTIKKKYSAILKKYVESEYPEAQKGNIPELFKPLFN